MYAKKTDPVRVRRTAYELYGGERHAVNFRHIYLIR
jgi:hypothetical protein